MSVLKQIGSCSRVAIPLMFGICIGVALSFIILPVLEERSCEKGTLTFSRKANAKRSHSHLTEGVDMDSFRNPEFEPKVIPGKQNEASSSRKPTRYRFAASEIDIKETVMIAYMTSFSQLKERAQALNISLNKPQLDYPQVMFFMSEPHELMQSRLPLTTLDVNHPAELPMQVIKYLAKQFNSTHKFFLLAPDTVFVKGNSVKALLMTAPPHNSYFGVPLEAGHCDYSAGIIMSQAAIMRLSERMKLCEGLFTNGHSVSAALGECLYRTTGVMCSDIVHTRKYGALRLTYDMDLSGLENDKDFWSTHVISNIITVRQIYQIRRLITRDEMRSAVTKIDGIRQQLTDMFAATNMTSPWPADVRPPFKTINRYDVIRWTLTSNATTYLPYDYINKKALSGEWLADQNSMVGSIMSRLQTTHPDRYILQEIVQAYRKLDPTRGLEYIFTLRLLNSDSGRQENHVFELVKPLGEMELMDGRGSPESTAVHVLIPLWEADSEAVMRLLETFTKTFTRDSNVRLHFLLIYGEKDYALAATRVDQFSSVKIAISNYEAKIARGETIKWMAMLNDSAAKIFTRAGAQFPSSSIVFTSTLTTDLTTAFISRLRSNTIEGKQIYAPIAFWQYQPDLVYDKQPFPHRVEVARSVGHFGENWYTHLAFFVSDMRAHMGKVKSELVDMFIAGRLEVMRAPDPELTVRHREESCASLTPFDEQQCEAQKIDHIASGPILAKKLLQAGIVSGKTSESQ